jgi:hypothetical protein
MRVMVSLTMLSNSNLLVTAKCTKTKKTLL